MIRRILQKISRWNSRNSWNTVVWRWKDFKIDEHPDCYPPFDNSPLYVRVLCSLCPASTVANEENNEIRIGNNAISGPILLTLFSIRCTPCHIILHSPPFLGQTRMFKTVYMALCVFNLSSYMMIRYTFKQLPIWLIIA